jgi:diguanylate cyclase (GGDEF)-like protein
MRRQLTHTLRFRLLVASLAVEALMLALLVGNGLRLIQDHLVGQASSRIAAIEQAYKTAVAGPLAARDYATLRDILDGWQKAEDVSYLVVTDPNGRVLAAAGWPAGQPLPPPSAEFRTGEIHHVRFPAEFLGQVYGHVQYGLSLGFLESARRDLFTQSLLIALGEIALSFLLLSVIGFWLTRRLVELADASSRVAAGEYDIRLAAGGDDEVATLAANFNAMARAVETRVHELRFQARHDSLTGLHNRRAFEEELAAALARRGARALFVLYIDLDQFKAVNDACGHATGDLLLQKVATYLMQQRAHGFVARLGGDEFALILEDGDATGAHGHARRIIEDIRRLDFVWEGRNFGIGASVGIAQASDELDTVTGLLIAADSACYAAKERGRHRAEIYRSGDDWYQKRQEEFLMLPLVTEAIADGRFVLYHQRIRPLRSARGDHAEVLVRMLDADGGLVEPGRFIGVAERYNLMPYLDRWILEAVLKQIAAWRAVGRALPFHHLAVNLSGATLDDAELPRFLNEKLAEHAVDPRQLCFEITESAAIADPDRAFAFIDMARGLGAAISLDDFGSGLSSFGYLKRFRVDYLKIDGQFVKNLDQDVADRAVVEAMVSLARAHGLHAIAEYVASPELLDIVRSLGVDFAQGYAVHRPSPLAEA